MERFLSLKKDKEYISEIVIERSRFLGYAKRVETQEEAQEYVKQIRQKHSDARHVVYAYRLFDVSKSTDDGEPSGTAGRPILEYLSCKEIYQVVMVVVRYFGGIKLGTGGLVRAYTNSTIETIQNELKVWQELDVYEFTTDYSGYQDILGWAKNKDVKIGNVQFEDKVTGEISTLQQYEMPKDCKFVGKKFDYWEKGND